MERRLREFAESTFDLPVEEGSDKVTSLEEAIRQNVRPGATLFLAESANAATREVLRQFWGTKPDFTLAFIGGGIFVMSMIHGGLVKKVICSGLGGGGGPGRNAVVQKAYKEKTIEIESWSLFSIPQRLMAGAFDFPFMPTKSIAGSTMAEENSDTFQVIDDPFGTGRKIGLVQALNPDVALYHACAADRYGNAIMVPAIGSGHGPWGAFAATQGVILTVDKLVSTDFIREHSTLVRIPGYMVKAVVVAPFGAHPASLIKPGLPEVDPYSEDHSFSAEQARASQSLELLDTWIQKWVLDCPSQEAYLAKVGLERLMYLKGKAASGSWRQSFESLAPNISDSLEYRSSEMMIVASARKMAERILKNGYRVIQAGAGASGLASWLAYYSLKKAGHDIDLVVGSGWYGISPRPGDPGLLTSINVQTLKVASDVVDAYGVWIGGATSSCLTPLGAAQTDKYGNINSTLIPGEMWLVGSGGANDAVNAREVVLVVRQSKGRYLEHVQYITAPGTRVRTLVSQLAVFEKLGENNELSLTACFSGPESIADRINQVKENCGWDLKVSSQVAEIPPPTLEELLTIRMLDPEGRFID
jgi:acyl CoA:acetate/3-ketoacid CoA transferase alpha subunit/acyl CoA:acetate/3-ketoacid CoA transferase beta subunit